MVVQQPHRIRPLQRHHHRRFPRDGLLKVEPRERFLAALPRGAGLAHELDARRIPVLIGARAGGDHAVEPEVLLQPVQQPGAAAPLVFGVGDGHPAVLRRLPDPVGRQRRAAGPDVLRVPHREDHPQIQVFGFQQERRIVHRPVHVHVAAPPAALAHADPRLQLHGDRSRRFHLALHAFVLQPVFSHDAVAARRRQLNHAVALHHERAQIGRARLVAAAAGAPAEQRAFGLAHGAIGAAHFETSCDGAIGFIAQPELQFHGASL